MITEISFRNYKLFDTGEWVTIPIKPITVLVGPNGSGKSTVMRFIKSLTDDQILQPLTQPINEPFFDLYNFSIKFDNGWEYSKNNGKIEIINETSDVLFSFDQTDLYDVGDRLLHQAWFLIDICYKKRYLTSLVRKDHIDDVRREFGIVYNFDLFDLLIDKILQKEYIALQSGESDCFDKYINSDHEKYKYYGSEYYLKLFAKSVDENYSSELYFILYKLVSKLDEMISKFLLSEVNDLSRIETDPFDFRRIFDEELIIGDFSDLIKKSEAFTGVDKKVKSKSRVLYLDSKKRIPIFDNKMNSNQLQEMYKYDYRFRYEFDLSYLESEFGSIISRNVELSTRDGRLLIDLDTEKRFFEDLSRGELNLLMLLLILSFNPKYKGLYTDSSSIYYYLNEPEISLHPAWQSTISRLFIDKIRKKVSLNSEWFKTTEDYQKIKGNHPRRNTVFIETHSEYLIRGLQVEAAKAKLTDEVQILYFDGKGGVKPINLNKDGSLTDSFGPGFYDESERLSMLILENMASKS